MTGYLLFAAMLLLVFLDLCGRIDLTETVFILPLLLLSANVPMLVGWRYYDRPLFLWLLFILYLWLRLNILPLRDGRAPTLRLKVMIGGRFLVYRGLLALLVETLFIVATWQPLIAMGATSTLVTLNAVYGVCIGFFILWNGILRMFFTSRRLSVSRRVLMVVTMWIPLVNLWVLGLACRLVYEEYDFALYKQDLHLTRADSDLCATRYPLVMVHGVLFRDLRWFNYWGRIPKELMRYGARIFYGNQEAVGTVVNNAADIRTRILEIVEETGCEKVNIIAHSKGGLDARYCISRLGMEGYVASLTTLNSPHHGCRVIDVLIKIVPDGLYRALGRIVDGIFKKIGDENPDFYTATRQFARAPSAYFNREVPDAEGVYYQSYMSRMKGPLSCKLLALPYLCILPAEGKNDGLVAVEAAKWGEFRQLFESSGRRGIGHGDMIDLNREDYKGFDVMETYVGIVSELKARGF